MKVEEKKTGGIVGEIRSSLVCSTRYGVRLDSSFQLLYSLNDVLVVKHLHPRI